MGRHAHSTSGPALGIAGALNEAKPHAPPNFLHQTVMLHEAVDALALHSDSVVVDATFGRGGHSRLILERLGPKGRLWAFDQDPQAIEAAVSIQDRRFKPIHGRFGQISEHLAAESVFQVNAVLMDLGVSSPQIDDATRGFSFRMDGPLDMRMDPQSGNPTVADWLAQASAREIAKVIRDYGEDRFAFPIAQAIAARCALAAKGDAERLRTTRQLADLVASVVRSRQSRPEQGQHPATRVFQAFRVHINRELDELAKALAAIKDLLVIGGRLAVISFHSLEDRIVKRAMRSESEPREGSASDRRRAQRIGHPQDRDLGPFFKQLSRQFPSEVEVAANPRARSAVLRVAEKLGPPAPGQHVSLSRVDAALG